MNISYSPTAQTAHSNRVTRENVSAAIVREEARKDAVRFNFIVLSAMLVSAVVALVMF